jgi:replicative DNA helicase
MTDLSDVQKLVAEPMWSPIAEQAVLGALMLDNRAWPKVSGLLSEASFWHAGHRVLWVKMAEALNAKRPVDTLTLAQSLEAAGVLADVGGLAYLAEISASVPSAANIGRYAEAVAERAAQRAVVEAADKALEIAKGDGEVGDKLDRIAAELVGVQRDQMRKEPRLLADLLASAIDRYEALADGRQAPAWATGIAPLDRVLGGGLRPGKVYGIAARPSVGKSSAARALAAGVAFGGHPVLVLSQEMPADEVADCMVAQLGRVSSQALQTGKFRDEDWGRITDGVETAKSLPIYIDDDGGLTIAQIRGKARMVRGLRVLVLDYLQLSTSTLKNASTNDQVAEISKGLKQLALQLGIAVVVLSQLNRDVERRADREPQLSDLRDSGAIEQDLDVAVLLWTARENDDGPRLVGWKVAKHRGGPKAKFAMTFDAAVYAWAESFESLEQKPVASKGGSL